MWPGRGAGFYFWVQPTVDFLPVLAPSARAESALRRRPPTDGGLPPPDSLGVLVGVPWGWHSGAMIATPAVCRLPRHRRPRLLAAGVLGLLLALVSAPASVEARPAHAQ